MNYFRIVYPQSTKSAVKLRPSIPSHCTKFYRSSLNFDITSTDNNNRCEYWESSQGTLTKAEVDQLLYSGNELSTLGISGGQVDTLTPLNNLDCDMLEVSLNNLTNNVLTAEVRASASNQSLESISVGVKQVVTLTIPKPYANYAVFTPAGLALVINRYVL